MRWWGTVKGRCRPGLLLWAIVTRRSTGSDPTGSVSLAREPHVDKVETPKAAVSMAKKTSLVVVVIMALLTIYGTLI